MIVYGWNSYALKKFRKEDLGLFNNAIPDVNVEYRQKYFHLFFIPFFPIGRFWAVRKDGKLYEPSVELAQVLQEVDKKNKHAVWAWSGPLVIIAGFLLFNVSESIERSGYEKRHKLQVSMLTSFFGDKSKTAPLAKKLDAIYDIADSMLQKDDIEQKKIDTSEANILKLYFAAMSTREDSLSGYTEENTLIISRFRGRSQELDIVSRHCEDALKNGDWNGYYDTAEAFADMRKLEAYKYILVLKEYNRVDPEVMEKSFNSGYSLVNATLIDIATGEEKKSFKIMAGNSSEVQTFSYGSSAGKEQWRTRLESDLISNARQEARKYVFGEKETENPYTH